MSFSETIFLFFLALIIFGPKKLPEIARQVGKALNEFRRASNEFRAQIEHEITNLETEKRQTILPPTPPVEGATSRSLSAVSVETTAEAGQTDHSAANYAGNNHSADNHSAGKDADDEPLFAAASSAVTSEPPATVSDPVSVPDEVTSAASQESHA